MKFLLLSLLIASNVFAQVDGWYISMELSLSPFVMTRDSTRAIGDLSARLFNGIQNRGVGGVEQLRDDMHAYDQDLRAGLVKDFGDIRQAALKELVLEVINDKEVLAEIEAKFDKGTTADKVIAAIGLGLFQKN